MTEKISPKIIEPDFAHFAWDVDGRETLVAYLESIAERTYAAFSASLIPNAPEMLGVRMPHLRAIAKKIMKGEWQTFLCVCRRAFYEEILLEGLVCAGAKQSINAIRAGNAESMYKNFVARVENFLPAINNWGVCDCFSSSLAIPPQHIPQFFDHSARWLQSGNVWHIRAALVVRLARYLTAEYIARILTECAALDSSEYYVQMGEAWLIATCYAKFPEITESWLLNDCPLNNATLKLTIRKIRESNRVPSEKKAMLKQYFSSDFAPKPQETKSLSRQQS